VSTVQFEITGKTPLLMHAPTTVDPLHPVAKEIAKIVKAKKASDRTEDDHARLAELEWHAALYVAPGIIDGPVVPTANIKRSIAKGAYYTKGQKASNAVTNGLDPREMFVALAYEGPRDPDDLYKTGRFTDRRAVKGGGTVMRTRPKFDQWALVVDFEVDESLLDFDDLLSYAETAGRLGLCDGRKIGFGRFDVEMRSA
jgi:hypothetical protein